MIPKFRFSLLSVLVFITILSISPLVICWLYSDEATERAIRADLDLLPTTTIEIVTPVVRDERRNRESVWILIHDDDGYELRVVYRRSASHSRWQCRGDIYFTPYVIGQPSTQGTARSRQYSQRFPTRPSREVLESIIHDVNTNP